ncbi:LolA-like protein [Arundinibacter roseus]|uniref:Lipocalin-like domain-containing protein n=1 Tax=Arundinibacter roseus TaxID=2070510 RepID=A0A4R4K8R1_9BACT|nr:hypothetical protein [Arundinibacter roseus]TDB64117.1 hypothetical protein EZE20_14345 [Arundinibacter roseus]
MKKIALVFALMSLLGCSREEATPEERLIYGKWQLLEFCVSPGNGSCDPQQATAVRTQSLEFKKNGSFIQRIPQPGQFSTPIVSSGDFSIKTPGRINFNFDNKTTFKEEVSWLYELSDTLLTIRPQCIEGCAYTYERQ